MTRRPLPIWAVAVAALGVAGLLALFWRTTSGSGGGGGKDIQVRPGMYDLRAEMAKPRAGG